jgi:hypothetical protein
LAIIIITPKRFVELNAGLKKLTPNHGSSTRKYQDSFFPEVFFSAVLVFFALVRGAGASTFFLVVFAGFFPVATFVSPYFFMKRSTRPALSTNFCLPVKKGWQLEHISSL